MRQLRPARANKTIRVANDIARTARNLCDRYSRACVTSPMCAQCGAAPRRRQAEGRWAAESIFEDPQSGSLCRCEQLHRIQRAVGRFFMLEVSVSIAILRQTRN